MVWDHMKSPSGNVPRLMFCLVLIVSATCVVFTVKFAANSSSCGGEKLYNSVHRSLAGQDLSRFLGQNKSLLAKAPGKTELKHIVFGIAASAKLWEKRKNYIKLWWRGEKMRGIVWLDSHVDSKNDEALSLPEVRISGKTDRFVYKHPKGHRSAIRISRIVSETLKLGMENVRWFVMGDDDTFFLTENLVRVLNKYDHNQYYYIGSLSESHLQNIYFSYGMAYGGGGFAISYPLAKALVKMQDKCIQRYPKLYGSDERIQACMAELGVPLTKELGFHQYDVYGNLFGLLAAHPVTPLVSLHHLDVVEPIFPNVTQVEALQHLMIPMKLDSAGLIQQSICYEKNKTWTISVSWGFAVQIFRGVLSPREIEMPSRTFLNWYKRADYTAYPFNTRPVARIPCQKPFVFYLSTAGLDPTTNQTMSIYNRHKVPHPDCKWRKMVSPANIDKIVVYKRPDPHLWDRSPRRNCCRVLESKRRSLVLDVGVCREGEIAEI
ncbi:Transferring glycosyl group transferase [Heracleum sosnowskyi]|uniref:Transferring glycosyl group transferase n=1 Tax=Heracleum sosnowskyi TaxID=360622 RepID=A0AAD8HHV5_9APIA|nr:Transferring glycosyl group transferase [Heracleum sosnowskyi]